MGAMDADRCPGVPLGRVIQLVMSKHKASVPNGTGAQKGCPLTAELRKDTCKQTFC